MIDDTPGTIFPILFVVLVLSVFVLFISLLFGTVQSVMLLINNEFAVQRLIPVAISAGASIIVAAISIGLLFLSSAMRERYPGLREDNAQANPDSHQLKDVDDSEVEPQWESETLRGHIT